MTRHLKVTLLFFAVPVHVAILISLLKVVNTQLFMLRSKKGDAIDCIKQLFTGKICVAQFLSSFNLQFLHPAVTLANVISANIFSDHAKLIA